MEELLQSLEGKIRAMLEKQEKLEQVNAQLNQGKTLLVREKDALLTKQLKAISNIESLITRLKAIETLP